MRKCRNCLCLTCVKRCRCDNCHEKTESCENHIGFRQLSIFENPPEPKYQKATRRSWQHYGITKERRRQLEKHIRSGRYAPLAHSAAREANEMISEYILLSVMEKLSYESLEKLWAQGKIDRIPYGRTDFYGIRRCFVACFDKEMRKIGE